MMPGPSRANGIRSSAARVVVFLAIGALLFWLALKGQNVTLIRDKLAHARWEWAALSLVFAVASNLFRAARWNLLIHPLGHRPRLVNTFGAVVVGNMANLALPRLGEVTRCGVLHRYERTPFDKVFGTVVTERIIDVLTICLFLALVVFLAFDRIASVSMQYVVNPIGARFAALFAHDLPFYVTIAVASVALAFGGRLLYRRFRESRYFARLVDAMRGFLTGARTVQHLERRTPFVVLSLLIWVMYALMAYACFFCFPATAGLGMTAALAVLVFGGFGFAAPVQGGLGTFEIIVTPVLVAFGIPTSDALTYAILYHSTQVFGMAVFGVVAVATLPIINHRPRGTGLDRPGN